MSAWQRYVDAHDAYIREWGSCPASPAKDAAWAEVEKLIQASNKAKTS